MNRDAIFNELLRKYRDNRYLALVAAGVSEAGANYSADEDVELIKRRWEESR